MRKRPTSVMTAQCVAIVVILFAATALRLRWNDVAAYSPADETVYARYTETLTTRGFVGGIRRSFARFSRSRDDGAIRARAES